MLFSLLLLLLCLAPLPAESSCRPEDKSVTIRVRAEFFLRSLSRAPSSQKVITASTQFSNAYKEYHKSLVKSDAGTQEDDVSPGSIYVTESDRASYGAFSPSVSADLSEVFSSVSSYATRTPPVDCTCTCGTTVYTDSSEVFRETESSQEVEYHPGFLQLVRKLTYHVTIDGLTATLEEETLYSSVAIDSSLDFTELADLGKNYISENYGDAGGQISGKSFKQTKCYKLRTDEENDRLADLEEQVITQKLRMVTLEEKVTTLKLKVITQDDEIASQEDELTSLKWDLAAQDDQLASVKETLNIQDGEITSLNDTLTAQDDELATLKETLTTKNTELLASLTAHDNELTTMKETLTTQDGQLTTQKNTLTAYNVQLATQSNKITEHNNKIIRLDDQLASVKETLNIHAGEITSLNETLTAQDDELSILKETLTTKNAELMASLTAYDGELVSLNETVNDLNTSLNETLATQDDEITSLNETLIAQYDELVTLKETMTTKDTELLTSLTTHDNELTTMKETLTIQDGVLTTQKNTLSAYNVQLTTQSNKVTEHNNKILGLENKQTKIINAPQGLRSISCLLTCVGATGPGTTAWTGSSGTLYTDVDITGCGFVSTPVISTTVDGTGDIHHFAVGVHASSSSKFRIYMEGYIHSSVHTSWSDKPELIVGTSSKFNVNWHATGYTC